MVQWGIEQCKLYKAPLYLESTLEAAPLYEKNGLIPVEKFTLDLRGSSVDEKGRWYSEIVFVMRP